MKALKRWEAFLAHPNSVGWVSIGGACVKYDDLRSVLALANEASELKRRVRLARETFFAAKTVARLGVTNPAQLAWLVDLLDLRKPLPTSTTGRQRRRPRGR